MTFALRNLPDSSFNMPSIRLKRADRSNHVQNCRLQERCKTIGCKDTQLKYCYECFDFFTVAEWEDHCKNHLQREISRRCEIITYCHTLVRPGYCPFCLGCDRLPPSRRMSVWKRSNELRAHVNEDIKRMRDNYVCSHPMCNVKFDSEMHLRYHLSDIHGMNKAIWTQVGGLGRSPKNKGLNDQVNSHAGAGKSKGQGQGLLGQREKKRRQVGHGRPEDLQIIMWEYPDPPNHRVLSYDDPIPAGNSSSSPSANPEDLVIEFCGRPVETEGYPVRLCTTGPTFSSTSDESHAANREHIPNYNGCSPCTSTWPSPPDLTASVGFQSSTTSTSPELPPIDPQILSGGKDWPVELGKDAFESKELKEDGVLRSHRSSDTEISPAAETLRFNKFRLAEAREPSTNSQTNLAEANAIQKTRERQDKNPQTPSSSDSAQSSTTVESSRNRTLGRGPITRAQKRAAQSQENHMVSHKFRRVTRSCFARQNALSLKN